MTRLEGPFGWAQRVPCPPEHPNAATTVDSWFMELPNQGMGWEHFMLGVVSLDEIPGRPVPVKRYPRAEYELLVTALDPTQDPTPDDVGTWFPMEPVNVVEQFHGISREQAREVAPPLAYGCVNGRLMAETQMYVQMFDGSPPKMMVVKQLMTVWKTSVMQVVEHIRTGGLHERVN